MTTPDNTLATTDILALTQQVWESVLDSAIEITGDHADAGDSAVSGAVHIDGPWSGRVTIGCSAEMAARITGQMFELSPSDATVADIVDAVGEIANMIGGNVKALLPGPSTLSLPHVHRMEDEPQSLADGQHKTWEFISDGEKFVVTITSEHTPSPVIATTAAASVASGGAHAASVAKSENGEDR